MIIRSLDHFFDTLYGDQRMIALLLHDIIMETDHRLLVKIRYNIPFYDVDTWVCYINPYRQGVELCFLQGVVLQAESTLLRAKGRKKVAGITCDDVEAIPVDEIQQILRQAIALSATL